MARRLEGYHICHYHLWADSVTLSGLSFLTLDTVFRKDLLLDYLFEHGELWSSYQVFRTDAIVSVRKTRQILDLFYTCCGWRLHNHHHIHSILYATWAIYSDYMSRAKRICVFEHSVMTNFNCACPAYNACKVQHIFSFKSFIISFIWAASSEFDTYHLCEPRRFRRACAPAPEPPILAHTSIESRGTFRQKARSLAPLNGWACAVKICHDGMTQIRLTGLIW